MCLLQAEVTSRICHTCWMAADRAAVHMVSRPSTPSDMEPRPSTSSKLVAQPSTSLEVLSTPSISSQESLPVATQLQVRTEEISQPAPTMLLPDYMRDIITY